MPVYYFDTSVLLKKYRTERGTELVEELFREKRRNETFVTSYFTLLEEASVAARMLKAGAFTRRLYRTTLANLERDSTESLFVQSVSDAVVSEAIRQSLNHALRAPDAIHLATALGIRDALVEDIYFLCSDAKLKAACSSSGLDVLDPEETGSSQALKKRREK